MKSACTVEKTKVFASQLNASGPPLLRSIAGGPGGPIPSDPTSIRLHCSFAIARGVQLADGDRSASSYGTIATGVANGLPLASSRFGCGTAAPAGPGTSPVCPQYSAPDYPPAHTPMLPCPGFGGADAANWPAVYGYGTPSKVFHPHKVSFQSGRLRV